MVTRKLTVDLVAGNISTCAACEHGARVEDGIPRCGLDGSEVRFFDLGYRCPAGKFAVVYRGVAAKAVSLVRAVTSGEAVAEVVAARRASCDGCEHLVADGEARYCGACGCGRTPLSELSRKLRFAHVECPLKRPGFSNAAPSAGGAP